jgi:hypothetical protein
MWGGKCCSGGEPSFRSQWKGRLWRRIRSFAIPSLKVRYPPMLFSSGSYVDPLAYVDGPLASIFVFGGERRAALGHMSGLLARTGSLALMKFDDPRLPIKGASSGLPTHCGVSDGLRSSRRVVHHVVVALANHLSLRSPFDCVALLGSGLGIDGAAEGFAGGDHRPDDSGELVANATATTLAG